MMIRTIWRHLREETTADAEPLVPSSRTYNALMRSLGPSAADAGRSSAADRRAGARDVIDAFEEAVALGVEVDHSMYKHALRACDLTGEWRRAIALLEDMLDAGCVRDREARSRREMDTLALPSPVPAGTRRRCSHTRMSCPRARATGARRRCSASSTRCAPPGCSQTHSATTLRSRRVRARVSSASRCVFLGRWRRRCARRDRTEIELRSVDLASPRSRRETATGDYLHQDSEDAAPTVHTYTALLRACAPAGACRDAMRLLREMGESDEISPLPIHFNCAIEACSRGEEPRKVTNLLRQMEGRGLTPDLKAFTTAISACAKANQLNKAISITARMYQLEVSPDVATYNVLLQCCDRMGRLDELTELVDTMPKLGVEPNLVNYNTAVRALARGGRTGAAAKVISTMADRGVAPEYSTYRQAINGSCDGGHLEAGVAYLDQLRAAGFEPDYAVKYALLSTCARVDAEAGPFLETNLGMSIDEALAKGPPRLRRVPAPPGERGRGRGRGERGAPRGYNDGAPRGGGPPSDRDRGRGARFDPEAEPAVMTE